MKISNIEDLRNKNIKVSDIESLLIKLASPEDIEGWSHGEVTKPETINYRTQRPEKDGLFCEKIFGPEKDYQCYCGKYKGVRYKGIVCERCGVEITKSFVRRERMGLIKLAVPVAHVWFLKGVPSMISEVLGIAQNQIEKVVYFSAYIIISVNEEEKNKILGKIEKEYKEKIKEIKQKEQAKEILEKQLQDLKANYQNAKKEVEKIVVTRVLSEIEYQILNSKYEKLFVSASGAEALRKLFEKIDLNKEIKHLEAKLENAKGEIRKRMQTKILILKSMFRAGIRPEWMFLKVLPVLPPDLRPMVQLDGGRYASSDLNDLYRRVINRNNRLKNLLEIEAPDVIIKNEKRMLQEAVDALIDNQMKKKLTTKSSTGGKRVLKSLAELLEGKKGRFRQNLLGKRVDYSGRSVIVVGPSLKLHQVGLPKSLALELFRPFIIRKILEKELAYNVRNANRLIDEKNEEIWAILEEIIKDKVVLLNRAPTLHRISIQAFYPILVEGNAIQLHPLVCKAFNADFDGDQMSVHLPLSTEAQNEAKTIMLSTFNLLKPSTGIPIISPNRDMNLGCYWITDIWEGAKGEGKVFSSREEAMLAYENGDVDIKAKIKVRLDKKNIVETSVGRIIFNTALPEDFPFQNEVFNSKKLEKLTFQIIQLYSPQVASEILNNIKKIGFEFSTTSSITWGMDDLIIPAEKEKIIEDANKETLKVENDYKNGLLTEKEKKDKIIEIWNRAKIEVEKIVPLGLGVRNFVHQIISAGARASWNQIVQLCGMKGLVVNPGGEIIELPVKHSYKEGFTVLEYFSSTHGARKGTVDTALRTSVAGYLTRRLVDVAHEVIVRTEDCHDKEGIIIRREDAEKIGEDLTNKILGRYVLEDVKVGQKIIVKKGEIIDFEKAKEIIDKNVKEIRVRSPFSCKARRGVCQKCYGWNLATNKPAELGDAVGILAAQSIGEPGTQLTMRTFHMGGVAGTSDITMGLPQIEKLFECRTPEEKGHISEVDGKVIEITKDKIIKIKSSKEEKIFEYQALPHQVIFVKTGDEVKAGDELTNGELDVKEIFKISGKEKAFKYLLNGIQTIYCAQGVDIHDKHIEVILRQMFSRIKIKDSGDSLFNVGEEIEKAEFVEENARLKEEGKKPAKGEELLMRISRVALTSGSFLSSASFQETSRVLIKAAIEGKRDNLYNLKENVIIGKLIPAGTGFKKDEKKEIKK